MRRRCNRANLIYSMKHVSNQHILFKSYRRGTLSRSISVISSTNLHWFNWFTTLSTGSLFFKSYKEYHLRNTTDIYRKSKKLTE